LQDAVCFKPLLNLPTIPRTYANIIYDTSSDPSKHV
jgi:hypothetical protein